MNPDLLSNADVKTFAVVTTIQPPTPSIDVLLERVQEHGIGLVVMGDLKGPFEYSRSGVDFYPLARQQQLALPLAAKLPTNHYSRKNLGFLVAMSQGAACIYETDDDTAPLPTWMPRKATTEAHLEETQGWVNVYQYFDCDGIWPRGFPLEEIRPAAEQVPSDSFELHKLISPIHQGLVSGSPDVDAVWRLTQERIISFSQNVSVALGAGAWCPFNSQNTWWWMPAFPLMYLPSHCSFRMTDIWRSFVAQRCLWELDYPVVFHSPEVYQQRNQHNHLDDFRAEIPGYLLNGAITACLADLQLQRGGRHTAANMRTCYEALVRLGVFPEEELSLLHSWLESLRMLLPSPSPAFPLGSVADPQ